MLRNSTDPGDAEKQAAPDNSKLSNNILNQTTMNSPSGNSPAPQTALFSGIQAAPADPIFGLKKKFIADSNPNKVDLSAGVYKDGTGTTPKLAVVSDAEKAVIADVKGGYLPIEGHAQYIARVQELVFGAGTSALTDERIASVQSVGGTSALFYGARFIKTYFPNSEIYVSDPTWANHNAIFETAGVGVKTYPYYDKKNHSVDFDALTATLASLPSQSVVLLHGCCHNPTGLDLSSEQWQALANIFKQSDLVPFIDFAYQGFAEGIEQDAAAIRNFADADLRFLVANSFSKNFSLYNRRIGAFHAVCGSKQEADSVHSQVKRIVRTSNSNPPIDGALIVEKILSDPALRGRWEVELGEMRDRIKEMRHLFVDGLKQRGVGDKFEQVQRQNGMFSYSGLSKEQVQKLQDQHGIYPVGSGRICVASLTKHNIDYVLDALAAVSK